MEKVIGPLSLGLLYHLSESFAYCFLVLSALGYMCPGCCLVAIVVPPRSPSGGEALSGLKHGRSDIVIESDWRVAWIVERSKGGGEGWSGGSEGSESR
jgi:hypothetical protein